MSKVKYLFDGVKLSVAYVIANILKILPSNRDIWLVGERRDEARDNGYHMFKYIRENHSKDKVYYVIGKDSKDVVKLKNLGNIIYADTFKHYLYYALSNKLVIAHLGSCVPDSPVCWKAEEKKIIKSKRVFIQHGITQSKVSTLMYKNTNASLFICGAKPEYDFIMDEFGYPEGNVKYTGFARFDNLHDFKVKTQILVMPTWRQWIPSMTWSNNDDKCKKEFLESDYYKKFNELINNKQIKYILEKNHMKMIFYPHHEMQGYIELFKSNCDDIIVASEDDYDIQQLLKESMVLITDYSSIMYDFAYMRKPVIYYQFDETEYYESHYPKGYFKYEDDGFGPIVRDVSQLSEKLNECITYKNNKYNDRINKFFKLHDKENSKRIYHLIKEM